MTLLEKLRAIQSALDIDMYSVVAMLDVAMSRWTGEDTIEYGDRCRRNLNQLHGRLNKDLDLRTPSPDLLDK